MNYDLVDQLAYSKGKHAFKFGGEVRDGRVTQIGYGTGKGVFTFAGKVAFADFHRPRRLPGRRSSKGANRDRVSRGEP